MEDNLYVAVDEKAAIVGIGGERIYFCPGFPTFVEHIGRRRGKVVMVRRSDVGKRASELLGIESLSREELIKSLESLEGYQIVYIGRKSEDFPSKLNIYKICVKCGKKTKGECWGGEYTRDFYSAIDLIDRLIKS